MQCITTTRSTPPSYSHTARTGLPQHTPYVSTLEITIMLLNFIPPPARSDTTMISKVFRGKRRGSAVAVPCSPPPQPEIQRPKRTLPPDLQRWSDFEDPFPSVSVGGYIRYYRSRANSVKEPSHISIPSLCCAPPPSSLSDSAVVVPTAPLFPSCSSSAASSPTKHMEKLADIAEAKVSSETLSPAITRASPACNSSPPPLPRVNSLRRKRRRLLRTPSIERDFAVSARQLFASHISLSLSTSSSSDPHYPTSHSVDSNCSSGEESPLTPLSRSSSSASASSSSASAKSPTTPSSEKPPVTVVVGVDDPTTLLMTPDAEEKGDHARLDVDVDVDLLALAGRPDTWASYYTALSDFDDI